MKDKICSSALIKIGTTSKQGLVPATDVLKEYGDENYNPEIPDWVSAWIEAESQRPWSQG